jgi:hypothetical protein
MYRVKETPEEYRERKKLLAEIYGKNETPEEYRERRAEIDRIRESEREKREELIEKERYQRLLKYGKKETPYEYTQRTQKNKEFREERFKCSEQSNVRISKWRDHTSLIDQNYTDVAIVKKYQKDKAEGKKMTALETRKYQDSIRHLKYA